MSKTTSPADEAQLAVKQSIAAHFEKFAPDYAKHFDRDRQRGSAVQFKLRTQFTLELLRNEKPSVLLDVATGSGHITHAVAAALAPDEIVLNDISPAMLGITRSLFEQRPVADLIQYNEGDCFELLRGAGANRFDVIICLGVIAHTGRLDELLALSVTSLRPGGVLILQSTLTDHVGSWVLSQYARSRFRGTSYKVSTYAKRDVTLAAEKAGLLPEAVIRYGVSIPFGDRLLGKLNYHIERRFGGQLRASGGEAVFRLRKPA